MVWYKRAILNKNSNSSSELNFINLALRGDLKDKVNTKKRTNIGKSDIIVSKLTQSSIAIDNMVMITLINEYILIEVHPENYFIKYISDQHCFLPLPIQSCDSASVLQFQKV